MKCHNFANVILKNKQYKRVPENIIIDMPGIED